MAKRGAQVSGGSGFAAVFLVLLVVGLVVKYIWWFVGAAALVGLYFVAQAMVRRAEERRQLAEDQAADREFELKRHTDRQRRWTLMGDSRAVYGEAGAAATRDVIGDDDEPAAAHDDSSIARLATTATEVDALVRDKPQGWPQALFASILVQRNTALLSRLRDSELGFTPPRTTTRTISSRELEFTIVSLIDEMLSTMRQMERFTNAPAFMAAFNGPGEDSEADADAIKHIAHRLMDFHERFLELSERCRGLSVRSQYDDIVADCARLLDGPLQSYREFIGDFVDVINALPRILSHASGTVHLGDLGLFMSIDDQLRSRLFKRLDAINGS